MDIRDIVDNKIIEMIVRDWSKTSGLVADIVDLNGKSILSFKNVETISNFDSIKKDIKINEIKIGEIRGIKVLKNSISKEGIKKIADKLEIDDTKLFDVLSKENFITLEEAESRVEILESNISKTINLEQNKKNSEKLLQEFLDEVREARNLIEELNQKSLSLDKIESSQKMLSLNASIESARAGDAGRGFAIVASEIGKLTQNSGEINKSIKKTLKDLTDVVESIGKHNKVIN